MAQSKHVPGEEKDIEIYHSGRITKPFLGFLDCSEGQRELRSSEGENPGTVVVDFPRRGLAWSTWTTRSGNDKMPEKNAWGTAGLAVSEDSVHGSSIRKRTGKNGFHGRVVR